VYRALRQVNRALEALYPLAGALPTVDRLFLAADDRAVGAASTDATTGVLHFDNETDERGGYSVYVPEDYDPANAYPLVMALHGGAGHGRLFLWSWLREVRGRGVILVAPTATGDTWSLMEPQVDSGHLGLVLESVARRWSIDRSRLLLTGMSDGGTFTLLSGLDDESPFTHLAPVAASFHPLLLAVTEPRRVADLPIYLVHGALDWMFPVSMGRAARQALTAAGAALTYREIADLSHVYPREEGSKILDWFLVSLRA
jgi:phospholipase/carboxylesterase